MQVFRPWQDANQSVSDYFNYDLTEQTFLQLINAEIKRNFQNDLRINQNNIL